MKRGPGDRKYGTLITGRELTELKKFTWAMTEAFGFDRRIERYQGTRPLMFHTWDLDCLVDVIAAALDDSDAYPTKAGPGYKAMVNLSERINALRQEAYAQLGKR